MRFFSVSIIILVVMSTASPSMAQPLTGQSPSTSPEDRVRYGLEGSFDLNMHTANFQALLPQPNCSPGFQSGSGTGSSFGALVEFPLAKKFSLDLRASYVSNSASLTVDEGTTLIDSNQLLSGTFRHSLNATLASFGVEPLAVYKIIGGLKLELGGRIGFVITKTFSQQEQIVAPTNYGTFLDGTRIRNQFSGTIPNASSIDASLLGGIRYELPMNASGSLSLAPEVMYAVALTPVSSAVPWHANALRFGVELLYTPPAYVPPPVMLAPPPEPSPTPTPSPTPAPVAQKPGMAAALAVSGVEADGREAPVATLRIEEFISTGMRPLLPYIFFDENSDDIADRYQTLSSSEAQKFSLDGLHQMETLPVYRHILNIIGKRLRDNPIESILLVGCNADRGAEKGRHDLSESRAATIQKYFHKVWGIDNARMKIVVRDLPQFPSSPDSVYGAEENRRVEIHSDAWSILEPVVTHDTLRTANPPVIRFRDTVRADGGVQNWSLVASQSGAIIKVMNANGDVPQLIDWHIDAEKESIPKAQQAINATLAVTGNNGETVQTFAKPLAVDQLTIERKREQRTADHTIDEYSLILFDFDKADISAMNEKLCGIVKEKSTPASTMTITGYCDSFGEKTHNRALALERANATARTLGAVNQHAMAQPDGVVLFPNDTPEGRFYCRTVVVQVETPVEH